jgi:hypothetical protein
VSDGRRHAPPSRASYHNDDDAIARARVAKIIEKEMSCPDDHWNDEFRTRPDAAWLASYHDDDDAVQFCGRPYSQDEESWINGYLEVESEVIELRRSGHARARGILDLPYEMAFTCDDCRLWAFVGHRDAKDSFSDEERHGALFSARSCEKDAVHKTFGKPFDPNAAWEREEIAYDLGMDGSDLRMKKSSRTRYNKMRRERARAEMEANRETTTS